MSPKRVTSDACIKQATKASRNLAKKLDEPDMHILDKGEAKPTPSKTSHLLRVEAMPDDVIQIKEYGKHEFNNLFYSPSTKNLYQKYAKRIREIPTHNEQEKPRRNIYARSTKGESIYLSVRKLLKKYEE